MCAAAGCLTAFSENPKNKTFFVGEKLMSLIRLMLCCNDWRNGLFSGRCSQITLDYAALTLESPYADSALKCAIGKCDFRLGKDHVWPQYGHTEWLGNWCWD